MIAVAALFAAVAGWMYSPPPARARLRALATTGPERHRRDERTMRTAAAILLGIAIWIFMGSAVGLVAGGAAAFAARAFLSRLTSRRSVDEERLLRRQVAAAVGLLSATVATGVPPVRAIAVVAEAIEDPLRSRFERVATLLMLGADQREAWRDCIDVPDLAHVAAAFARSESTGAPIGELLQSTASEVMAQRVVDAEVEARQVGVRAFVPLAVCFLPAFVLLAGIPMVVTMAASTGLTSLLSP